MSFEKVKAHNKKERMSEVENGKKMKVVSKGVKNVMAVGLKGT